MYEYRAPLIRKLHKCYYCKKRLSKVPKGKIVVEFIYFGDGGGIDHFYCNKDCARGAKIREAIIEAERKELNDCIRREAK